MVKLVRAIDWRFLEEYLSDEVLCERWVENPYYQLFCGEGFLLP